MKTHTVIDGNAFYEIDEECLERRKKGELKGTGIARECGFRMSENQSGNRGGQSDTDLRSGLTRCSRK